MATTLDAAVECLTRTGRTNFRKRKLRRTDVDYRDRVNAQNKVLRSPECKRLFAYSATCKRILNPAWDLTVKARARAKKRGWTCNLTVEYVESIWPSDNQCPLCRETMIRLTRTAPSLDRIDNSHRYEVGYVRVICRRCNMSKADFDLSLARCFALNLVPYMEGRL